MKTLLLATRNKWKAQLFAPILQGYGFNIITLKDTKINKAPPVEDGDTVVENALIKARHYHSAEFPWVFGDDSGLEIKALNGEPGVQHGVGAANSLTMSMNKSGSTTCWSGCAASRPRSG
jgi:XTP/dITP diphosphohydrolase